MKKILEIFKKEVDENDEGYWFNNDKTFQMFDYMDFVSVTFDPPVKNKKDTPICFLFILVVLRLLQHF